MIDKWQLVGAVLAGLLAVAIFIAMKRSVEHMNRLEAEAARWRWEHITQPAMETCRNRGGIANTDGWGKVLCDR